VEYFGLVFQVESFVKISESIKHIKEGLMCLAGFRSGRGDLFGIFELPDPK